MAIKHFIISWDHRAQPDWVEIQDALNNFVHPQLTVIEHTGEDQFALIVAEWHLPPAVAQEYWEAYRREGP